MPHRSLPLLLLLACAPGASDDTLDTDDGTPDAPARVSEPEVVLATTLSFARANAGVSAGFDLDGSAESGVDACGPADYVDPAGHAGIDNAFAALLPIIETTGGQALKDLVQDAVDSGELLLLFELDGHEDAKAGDAVQLSIVRGAGRPTLGGDGVILPSQTFDRRLDLPAAEVTTAVLQDDGSILGEGFDLRLPLHVFDETIDLTLQDGHVRLVPLGDGRWSGTVGGAILTQEVADNVLGFDAVPSSLINAITGALELVADLDPADEGSCTHMSAVMLFDGAPAFLFADEGEGVDTGTGDDAAGG
ncbi:MAG: hypothetical protein H6732_07025 [Alphaproteobacteria bacterium]|nr:hypothetical protein [Alphaproteobacteria bacterium]